MRGEVASSWGTFRTMTSLSACPVDGAKSAHNGTPLANISVRKSALVLNFLVQPGTVLTE